MFLNVSFNFATTISKFDTFSSYHIVRTWIAKVTDFVPFCTTGISMYQNNMLPYFIIPSTLSPQAYSLLEHSRQTDFNTPCSLSSFFFPLSAWGPTCRRNSTGLAELWGGWLIELDTNLQPMIDAARFVFDQAGAKAKYTYRSFLAGVTIKEIGREGFIIRKFRFKYWI